MRLIIDVPDELVPSAFAIVMAESADYAKRFDRPGWGWTFYRDGKQYWIRGIKGGLSVSLCKSPPSPGAPS